ncbi:MAG: glycosyltransferase family 9 protein [Nanoarchaeota archaeon]
MEKQKILIIKTGYTEILDGDQNSRIVSLGDVLRTTSLLHKYNNHQVTWVTSEEAKPLLNNNSYISRLLTFDLLTTLQLESEEFDKIINLEKVPGICALSDKIRARRSRYGFTFNTQTGEAEALDNAYEVLAVSFNPKYKKGNERTFQDLLFEMVGEKFNGEEYILGYKPKTQEVYDIGFNSQIGSKWPSKKWSMENWDELEDLLKDHYSVSRQENQGDKVTKNLEGYIDWINSCKTLVTNDSLGLHLALALKKNVIGLFSSTSHKEIYFYNRGKTILPRGEYDCLPCFNSKCLKYDQSCINNIFPEMIAKEIKSGF